MMKTIGLLNGTWHFAVTPSVIAPPIDSRVQMLHCYGMEDANIAS